MDLRGFGFLDFDFGSPVGIGLIIVPKIKIKRRKINDCSSTNGDCEKKLFLHCNKLSPLYMVPIWLRTDNRVVQFVEWTNLFICGLVLQVSSGRTADFKIVVASKPTSYHVISLHSYSIDVKLQSRIIRGRDKHAEMRKMFLGCHSDSFHAMAVLQSEPLLEVLHLSDSTAWIHWNLWNHHVLYSVPGTMGELSDVPEWRGKPNGQLSNEIPKWTWWWDFQV